MLSKDDAHLREHIETFCNQNPGLLVTKPNHGGSSIGVSIVRSPEEAYDAVCIIFQESSQALLEVFVEGQEFTLMVFQDHQTQKPVALLPTEIILLNQEPSLFSYRRKYLPTNNTCWKCPAFDEATNARIRQQAEEIFLEVGGRDFVRFDGWLCHGEITWSDFNPISGLEQNSFMFLQAARLGMTHQHTLRYVLQSALQRIGLQLPQPVCPTEQEPTQELFVLCGGDTAERQVSIMSGLNVFLQLRHTNCYRMRLFVLHDGVVWTVPYAFGLFHTVEEIVGECQKGKAILDRLQQHYAHIAQDLHVEGDGQATLTVPEQMSLEALIALASQKKAFMFLALHGGCGEDGRMQALLEAQDVPFNGSSSRSCALFMDKLLTGEAVNAAAVSDVFSLPKRCLSVDAIMGAQWEHLVQALETDVVVAKPKSDGCSAGVVIVRSARELEIYGNLLRSGEPVVPAGTFHNQGEEVVLPVLVQDILFEPFVRCDGFEVIGHDVRHIPCTGWIELTVGVIEQDTGLHVLSPSITLAEGAVLSLEEKFQGGTGVNITPPPDFTVTTQAVATIRHKIQQLAERIGVGGYARVDLFYNTKTAKICIIEVNALPGLTPSTVLYHQGVAETPSLWPRDLLQKLVHIKKKR